MQIIHRLVGSDRRTDRMRLRFDIPDRLMPEVKSRGTGGSNPSSSSGESRATPGTDAGDRKAEPSLLLPCPPLSPDRYSYDKAAVDGVAAVNARDRIGTGPWQDFKGEIVAKSVDDLHSAVTLIEAFARAWN
jgi:hypothetical protein